MIKLLIFFRDWKTGVEEAIGSINEDVFKAIRHSLVSEAVKRKASIVWEYDMESVPGRASDGTEI